MLTWEMSKMATSPILLPMNTRLLMLSLNMERSCSFCGTPKTRARLVPWLIRKILSWETENTTLVSES